MGGPLEGLTVVAVEQAVAAPFASCKLADAGARVIKIERPEGDFARGYDDVAAGMSSYFVWLNRGKESVVLDLRNAGEGAALERLIADADVLIQNLKPGALARLGFDFERLRTDYPRLITCSISGYAEDGPMADRKAYDLLVQAESGLCSVTGGPSEPARVGISIVDIATGATAHSAILEALIQRGVTGQGCHLSVSMFDVMADWLTVPLLNHEGGNSPQRIGLAHPSIAPYGVFETATGPLLLAVQSDREWARLAAQVIGQADLARDPRFSTNIVRCQNRSALDAVVAKSLESLDLDAALSRLDATGIAVARLSDMGDLVKHPELSRIEVETPCGPVSIPAPAARFDGHRRSLGPVPALGAP